MKKTRIFAVLAAMAIATVQEAALPVVQLLAAVLLEVLLLNLQYFAQSTSIAEQFRLNAKLTALI